MFKYTKSHIEFVVSRKLNGSGWKQIAEAFNKRFRETKTKDALRNMYDNLDVSQIEAPEHELADFTHENLGSIIKDKKIKKGRYFVTAASPTTYLDYTKKQLEQVRQGRHIEATNVDMNVFNSILNYCKRTKRELIILPMRAHVKALHSQPCHFDPVLKPYMNNFATEFNFNDHLKAVDMQLNPQQVNPLSGLGRLHGKKSTYAKRYKTSILFAHSKQDMEVIATGNATHARIIHATGCITKGKYLHNRVGKIAEQDHVLGGLVIDIDGGSFHLRQINITAKDRSFCDIGVRYTSDNKAFKERAECFKFGDIHAGMEDKNVLKMCYEVVKETDPKFVTIEDVFDGKSISHHLDRSLITKSMFRTGKFQKCYTTLQNEINHCKDVIDEIAKNCSKSELLMVASNHHEHLSRYLNEGRYIKDTVNHELSHRMVVEMYDGQNPLEVRLDPDNKYTWLDRNEDFFIQGVQVAAHGDMGADGAKGAQNNLELTHGDAMTAHTHKPGIHKKLFTVGHSSKKRHGYNNGPSKWIPCSGLIYKYGQKQLIMFIDNAWRLK